MNTVNLSEKLLTFSDHWQPRTVGEFNGHDLLNIRIWAEARNGGTERIPTKAGICCNVRLLPAVIEALHKAEAAARKAGLL